MDSYQTDGLHAVFMEAVRESSAGLQRTQWFLFPPSIQDIGSGIKEGAGRFIKRRIEKAGHRAKWTTVEKPSYSLAASVLKEQLDQYESMDGWEMRPPVVIRLEHDDYEKAMKPGSVSTPYKALRHVEAVTRKRGYRLTDG